MAIAELMNLGPVFLRREAIEREIDDGVLSRAVRNQTLVRVRHGVYADGAWWKEAGSVARHVGVAHAVARLMVSPYVYSHTTAVLLHGLPVWGTDLQRLHITHLGPAGGRWQAGVKHHATPRAGDGQVVIDGLPATGLARSLIDFAKTVDLQRALIPTDHALMKGLVTKADLVRQAQLQDHDPHSLRVRVVLAEANSGAQSVGESRSRFLFWQEGLPRPVCQFEVRDVFGTLIGFVDFAWPEYGVIVEFDGRIKYTDLLRPGETAADAVIREKEREDSIREATGWTVIRLTWDDLNHPRRTAERIRRAMMRTNRPAA